MRYGGRRTGARAGLPGERRLCASWKSWGAAARAAASRASRSASGCASDARSCSSFANAALASFSRDRAMVAPSFRRRARLKRASICSAAPRAGSRDSSTSRAAPVVQSVAVSFRAPRGAIRRDGNEELRAMREGLRPLHSREVPLDRSRPSLHARDGFCQRATQRLLLRGDVDLRDGVRDGGPPLVKRSHAPLRPWWPWFPERARAPLPLRAGRAMRLPLARDRWRPCPRVRFVLPRGTNATAPAWGTRYWHSSPIAGVAGVRRRSTPMPRPPAQMM